MKSAVVRGMAVFTAAGLLAGFTMGNLSRDSLEVKVVKPQKVKIKVLSSKDYAKQLLTPKHYQCLEQLLTKESHWNPKAVNPSSKASGVGQLMPMTWQSLNYIPTKNANAQVLATLVYVARHYGSGGPCKAWAYWQEHYNY